MKKLLRLIVLMLISSNLYAQQDPQFSQNMFLRLPVNPGCAGTNGAICFTGVYRNQWMGINGNPNTFLFSFDAPITSMHGGAGLTVANDRIGNFNFLFARAAYSYHLYVGESGLLGIGLEAGLIQASVGNRWIAPDGTTGQTDPAIPNDRVSAATYDVGAGIYYRTPKLYVGLSSAHLARNAQRLTAAEFNYMAARHYYVMAGYDISLSSSFIVRPSIHGKYDEKVATFDGNLSLLWNNTFWGGISYRLSDAIIPHIGFAFQTNSKSTIKIGYAYDLGISSLKSHHKNTHEVFLNYCIKFVPKIRRQSHINPRFLK